MYPIRCRVQRRPSRRRNGVLAAGLTRGPQLDVRHPFPRCAFAMVDERAQLGKQLGEADIFQSNANDVADRRTHAYRNEARPCGKPAFRKICGFGLGTHENYGTRSGWRSRLEQFIDLAHRHDAALRKRHVGAGRHAGGNARRYDVGRRCRDDNRDPWHAITPLDRLGLNLPANATGSACSLRGKRRSRSRGFRSESRSGKLIIDYKAF